jgi:hypothetical protein
LVGKGLEFGLFEIVRERRGVFPKRINRFYRGVRRSKNGLEKAIFKRTTRTKISARSFTGKAVFGVEEIEQEIKHWWLGGDVRE